MNVLVLRPPGNGSKYHSQFDDVIGQLLGRPGLDVTLLERLPGPDDATTERLALESLGGHIACLAWDEPGTVLADLEAAGKPMVRRVHKNDPQVPSEELSSSNGRVIGRLFYFDMRRADANRWIFAELQELLKTLQTPMFQIGSIGSVVKPKADAEPISKPVTEQSINKAQPVVAEPASTQPLSDEPSSDGFDDLDRLVDQLDELDI